MIVSKNGTSYDTSNGSEQPHAASSAPRERSEWEEINRWEDDGPGPHARNAAAAPGAPPKPAWSVLSLRRLMEAVRLLGRTDGFRQLRRPEAQEAEGDRLLAEQNRQQSAEAAAGRDRYQNAWENT